MNGWMEGCCVCTLYADELKDGWMDGYKDGCVCVHYIQMNGRMDG